MNVLILTNIDTSTRYPNAILNYFKICSLEKRFIFEKNSLKKQHFHRQPPKIPPELPTLFFRPASRHPSAKPCLSVRKVPTVADKQSITCGNLICDRRYDCERACMRFIRKGLGAQRRIKESALSRLRVNLLPRRF